MGTIMLNVLIACIKDLRVLVVFPNMELSESTKIRFQNDLIFHFLLSLKHSPGERIWANW